MAYGEQEQEQDIKSAGLTADRVTPDNLDAVIVSEDYWHPLGTTLTVCAITLKNGYIVTGESAAANRANFDEDIGKKIAREGARNKIWALEGYLLRQKLYEADQKMS